MQNEELIYFSCSSCGQDLSASPELYGKTIECPACNAALAVPFPAIMHSGVAKAEASPPPPPPHQVSNNPVSSPNSGPSLWNPNAAANWSLFFTPVFGTYLHAKNAEALGRMAEMRANKNLFYGSLFILSASLIGILIPGISDLSRTAMVILLLVWYFAFAKKQATFVKQAYGDNYPRKSLGKPLLLATCCAGGLFVIVVALSNWRDGGGGVETSSPNRSDERIKQDSDSSLIEGMTKTMILKDLKSPSTAHFSDFRIVKANPPFYQTAINVDAQNGFGAMIRTCFLCVFKTTGGNGFSHIPGSSVQTLKSMDELDHPGQFTEMGLRLQRSLCNWEPKEKTESDKETPTKPTKSTGAGGGAVEGASPPASTPPASTPVVGPPENVVRSGIDIINYDYTHNDFQRGNTLVSQGAKGLPAGTLIYPIKAKDYPMPFYFSQNEFGVWVVFVESMKTTIEIDTSTPLTADTHAKDLVDRGTPTQTNSGNAGSLARQPADQERRKKQDAIDLEAATKALAAVNEKIASERKRWAEATAIYNKETNNNTTTVQQGTAAHARCVQASNIINEVTEGAAGLKDEKIHQEAVIKSLKAAPPEGTTESEAQLLRRRSDIVAFEEATGKIVAIDSTLASDRKKLLDAKATINRVTNNNTTTVDKMGAVNYAFYTQAVGVINNVESNEKKLTKEKERYEAILRSLKSSSDDATRISPARTTAPAPVVGPSENLTKAKSSSDDATRISPARTTTSAPVVGPPESLIKAEIYVKNDIDTHVEFRRGETLVSQGMNGTPVGTLIYPIKVGDFPATFYFYKDEFGDWIVFHKRG